MSVVSGANLPRVTAAAEQFIADCEGNDDDASAPGFACALGLDWSALADRDRRDLLTVLRQAASQLAECEACGNGRPGCPDCDGSGYDRVPVRVIEDANGEGAAVAAE